MSHREAGGWQIGPSGLDKVPQCDGPKDGQGGSLLSNLDLVEDVSGWDTLPGLVEVEDLVEQDRKGVDIGLEVVLLTPVSYTHLTLPTKRIV